MACDFSKYGGSQRNSNLSVSLPYFIVKLLICSLCLLRPPHTPVPAKQLIAIINSIKSFPANPSFASKPFVNFLEIVTENLIIIATTLIKD